MVSNREYTPPAIVMTAWSWECSVVDGGGQRCSAASSKGWVCQCASQRDAFASV